MEKLGIAQYIAHVETFYQRSICFLHTEQACVRAYACFVRVCVSICVGSPCVCVPHISAYHPTAHLHCQPLQGLLICIFAVPLRNHKRVLSAFWEPGEYITDVQSAWVTHGISDLNMWTIYQVYHLFPLIFSLPASKFCFSYLFFLLFLLSIQHAQTEHRKYVKRIQSACLLIFVSQYIVSRVAASMHINRKRLATHLNIKPQNSTDACSRFCFFSTVTLLLAADTP